MKNARRIFIILWLLALAGLSTAWAQEPTPEPTRDLAFEQEIYGRLGQIDPEAVVLFRQATEAYDAGNSVAVAEGFRQVLSLAPDFPDALRRLSSVEVDLQQMTPAVRHAEQAYAVDPSPYNEAALAYALVAAEDPARKVEALNHARNAAQALPEEAFAQSTLLWAAAASEDLPTIRQASAALIRLVPDAPHGHFFIGLVAATDGHWEQAERELLLSQELGMPPEAVQRALAQGIRTQARIRRGIRWGGYSLAAWLVGLVLLTGAGLALSALTLSTVRRTQAPTKVHLGERILRSIYTVVIAVTSLYFYLSIPLLILIVVAAAAGIIWLFLSSGTVPFRLLLFVGLAAFYTLFAIVRSLFVRIRDAEPGRPLAPEEAPDLWSLARQVAERLDTRPVDAVYVTPGTEIAVAERGRLWTKLRGVGQRCLIVGLGVLPSMTQGQFRAILAHEYGHFSNRDTAGGNLAHQVLVSLHQMAYGLARSGQARWYNPAWLFLQGFYRIYLRVTLGASRLQEILADRYAALAYGVQDFTDGLKHVMHQSLAFDRKVRTEIEAAQQQQRGLRNLYALPPLEEGKELRELEAAEAQVMARPTSPYDSHPAPQERIALLRQWRAASDAVEHPEPAWALLSDRKKLQAEMTALVQARVRRQLTAVD